jgi:GTP pyrophosphokinase
MANPVLTGKLEGQIEELVLRFTADRERFERLAETIYNLVSKHSLLRPHIHSVKYRVKDPEHLRDKLRRKAIAAMSGGKRFQINPENLYRQITDLAGVRILHLHTKQMHRIDEAIREILTEERYSIVEGPIANTWDDEYRNYFKSISIGTTSRPSMYTSVHYIVESNARTRLRCELQVRTLVEEVWGEVSHTINYPHETESVSCYEQLRVLARVSSSCTRLVDSIFASHAEYTSSLERPLKSRKPPTIRKR